LKATLTARNGDAVIAGRKVTGAKTFNGQWPGPTMKVKPGDTIDLTFKNELDTGTNIHFHGMHVSPKGKSDNVLRHIAPHTTVSVVVKIPRDHASGLYWYHPHLHGQVNHQVYQGMAGLISIQGGKNYIKKLGRYKQRFFALQAPQLSADQSKLVTPDDADSTKAYTTINAQLNPRISMRPGDTELWRLGNISNEGWYKLQLEGHVFNIVGEDGNPYDHTVKHRKILIPPGKRFDVLVTAPKKGSFKLKRLEYNEGFEVYKAADIATLNVTGAKTDSAALPKKLKRFEDLRKNKIAARRKLRFKIQTQPKLEFLINGKVFDPARVDVRSRIGTTEEWTLINDSSEDHPFHIHTNEFQIIKIGGKKIIPHGYQDVVRIPRKSSVVFRMKFNTFTGKAVFHCHILFHEDHGMMGVVEFTRKKVAPFRIHPAIKSETSHDQHAAPAADAVGTLGRATPTAFATFSASTPHGTLLCHLPAESGPKPRRTRLN